MAVKRLLRLPTLRLCTHIYDARLQVLAEPEKGCRSWQNQKRLQVLAEPEKAIKLLAPVTNLHMRITKRIMDF